ncbi:MAG TPA: hypothetical protein PKK00_07010 [Bacteroidales bacterium]|nr:hypothetical protein [Bacteroidales bacterium]HPS17014.1 hypothetical protein [Bacteroidales bacterium]
MILILSDEKDFSTNDVIDWLNFYKAKYIKINIEECGSNTKEKGFVIDKRKVNKLNEQIWKE